MRGGSWVGYSEVMRGRPLQLLVLVAALASSISVLAGAGEAHAAEAGRVLVIGGGAGFRDAVGVVLTPWKLSVLPADMPPPRGVMPRAAEEARALGQRFNAVGVVWVAAEDHEYALFIYDAKTEQIVSRALDKGPPFDAPTAASHALSVKSLLRASTVAPPEERLGAVAPPVAPPPPQGATGTDEPRLVPTDPGSPPAPDLGTSLPPFEAPLLRAELGGAARIVADSPDVRLGAGLSLWPDANRRIGVGLEAQFGPGLGITQDRFTGRFSEVGVATNVRYRIPLARRFDVVPRVGLGLHATQIQGVVVSNAEPADESRVDGSVDIGATLDAAVARSFRLGVDLGASYMLRYQRYTVAGAQVLELHPLSLGIGLRLSTGLL